MNKKSTFFQASIFEILQTIEDEQLFTKIPKLWNFGQFLDFALNSFFLKITTIYLKYTQ